MDKRSAERLDRFQRRRRWAGFPIAVIYKFVDDQGSFLAAMVTYYAFLSLFPLLLLLVTILGFVLEGHADLQQSVLSSALARLPIIGDELQKDVHALRGSGLGLAAGLGFSLYGGLGVAQATQNALNKIWGVPRNERPNPIKSRLVSLGLILVFGLGVIAASALGGLAALGGPFGTPARYAAVVGSVAVNILLLLAIFRLGTARTLPNRAILPGAVLTAVCWQLLQVLGAVYVGHKLSGATAVYGFFAVVLGLLAWIYLLAVTLILSAEANAVHHGRMWPRALLTPFTDNVELTGADERAYTSYATAERFKGFETVSVDFDGEKDPPNKE